MKQIVFVKLFVSQINENVEVDINAAIKKIEKSTPLKYTPEI